MKNHFIVSNDHFSLAEEGVLPDLRDKAREQESSKLEQKLDAHFSKNTVNLFIAESDIFSLVHKLEGDIIICDIDRDLLEFIEQEKDFLLNCYEEYSDNQLDFDDVVENYLDWLGEYRPLVENRMEFLGPDHFLYSEENFRRSMQALVSKDFVTLDINMFDKEEQNLLCSALNAHDAKVKLFNLTNLPDYDANDTLPDFLKQIPWAEHPQIVWNIHDRGPTHAKKDARKFDFNTHYLFSTSDPDVYKRHVQERPAFFADIDIVAALSSKEFLSETHLIRYTDSDFCKIQNASKREMYKKHFYQQELVVNHEDQTSEALTNRICQRYQVKFPPRQAHCRTFLEKLNFYRSNIIKINTQNLNPELQQELKIQINDCLQNINLAKTSDFRNQNTQRKFLEKLDYQINIIYKLLSMNEFFDLKLRLNELKPCIDTYDEEMKTYLKNLIDKCIEKISTAKTQHSIPWLTQKLSINEDVNEISFLRDFIKATNSIQDQINIQYKQKKLIHEKTNTFLTTILADARSQPLKSKEQQRNFLNVTKQKVKNHFTHRLFDAEKHNIIAIFFNALMLVPVFGLIKLAATGTYFFQKQTHRTQIFCDKINQVRTYSFSNR